jgi:tetratricopeptide (TPR) repeat protein
MTSVPLAYEPEAQSVVEMLTAGKSRYHAGDFAGAASLFERALTLDPSNADARVGLGDTYIRQTPPAYERAIAEYRRALSINPRHEMAWQQLATAALHKKSLLIAHDAIEQLAKTNPSNPELNRLRAALAALER